LKKFISFIGLPVLFKELGIKEEDIDLLVKRLHDNKGKTFVFFKSLAEKISAEFIKLQ